MAKYFHGPNDHQHHYQGVFDKGDLAKPHENVVFEKWDEIYKGEKNQYGERHGEGSMEWNLDTRGQWRYNDWLHSMSFDPNDDGSLNSEEFEKKYGYQLGKEYDHKDKLNPDRKLRDIKILFKGNWEHNYPHGEGKLFLNNKLFCEATWRGGSLHGKTKLKITKFTLAFGINNNWLNIYSWKHNDLEEMKADKNLANFEGESLYGLANGYGKLTILNDICYDGEWKNGFPYGKGIKTYKDGRQEYGEFGRLNEGTIKLMTDYVEEPNGNFIFGTIKHTDGKEDKIDRRTAFQKSKSLVKDIIK